MAVEGLAADAAEVADAGDRDADQTIQELVHAVAAQGDLGTDGLALTQVERCDGLTGVGHHGLLAGDGTKVGNGTLDGLGVGSGLADAHVHDDLLDLRNLVDVLVLELLLQLVANLGDVHLLKTRNVLVCHVALLTHGVLSAGLVLAPPGPCDQEPCARSRDIPIPFIETQGQILRVRTANFQYELVCGKSPHIRHYFSRRPLTASRTFSRSRIALFCLDFISVTQRRKSASGDVAPLTYLTLVVSTDTAPG